MMSSTRTICEKISTRWPVSFNLVSSLSSKTIFPEVKTSLSASSRCASEAASASMRAREVSASRSACLAARRAGPPAPEIEDSAAAARAAARRCSASARAPAVLAAAAAPDFRRYSASADSKRKGWLQHFLSSCCFRFLDWKKRVCFLVELFSSSDLRPKSKKKKTDRDDVEQRHLRPSARPFIQVPEIARQNPAVVPLLQRRHPDAQDPLVLRRQRLFDIFNHAPEQVRPQLLVQLQNLLGLFHLVFFFELARVRELNRVQKVQQGPELAQRVLQRSPRHQQLVCKLHRKQPFVKSRLGVFQPVSLVDAEVVPPDFTQQGSVLEHELIGGDEDIEAGCAWRAEGAAAALRRRGRRGGGGGLFAPASSAASSAASVGEALPELEPADHFTRLGVAHIHHAVGAGEPLLQLVRPVGHRRERHDDEEGPADEQLVTEVAEH